MPSSWCDMVYWLNQYSHRIVCKVVYWNLPAKETFKCNSDGASKDNPGLSSGAYCVRNDSGGFIFAEIRRLGFCTNLVAKFKVFRLRLEYCINHNLLPITMETDSLSVKKIIDGI